MARKPVHLRALADRDLRQALIRYRAESPALAERFLARIEQVLEHIGQHPETGSLRYAEALDIPGLRCWPCRQFPWLVFYLGQPSRIEVIRVLHANRDMPESLRPPAWGE